MNLATMESPGKAIAATGRVMRRNSHTEVHAVDGGSPAVMVLRSVPEQGFRLREDEVCVSLPGVRTVLTQWAGDTVEGRFRATDNASASIYLTPAQARELVDGLATALAGMQADPAQLAMEVAS